MPKGKFIVIEGTDGSGKGEQTIRLVKRLKENNVEVVSFDFPRHGHPAAWFVDEYLNGKFGTLKEIDPRTASVFYALDRFEASRDISDVLESGKVAVANRYVASNLGHQGSKYDDMNERREYFQWNHDLEYGINGISKPDLNIILHVPAAIAQELVDHKMERQYLGGKKKRDLHETDLGHLQRTEEVYLQLTQLFPGEFTVVECVEDGRLLSIDEVHEKVWAIASKVLGV